MNDLLTWLEQRPPVPVPAKSVIAMPQFYAMAAARAEFDRDLAIDALMLALPINRDGFPCQPSYQDEQVARRILAALRNNGAAL